MKVFTLEITHEYEEDFGGYQSHDVLEGVYPTEDDAKFRAKCLGVPAPEYFIREWDV